MNSKNLALIDATTELPRVGDYATAYDATGEQAGTVVELLLKYGQAWVWVETNQTGTRWLYTLRTNGMWVDCLSGDDGPFVTFAERQQFDNVTVF